MKLKVNVIKRNLTKRNHTATHLLQKALREVLGNHVQQAGSLVDQATLRFDFSHFEALTKDELAKVEAKVNNAINLFMPVTVTEMSIEEAQKAGAMALFGEKYGKTVRVVNAGDWSIELCGGTHVSNTGEIGCFKIVSETGVAAGIRRIEATTSYGVLIEAKNEEDVIREVCESLKANRQNITDKAKQFANDLKQAKKELEEHKKAEMGSQVDDMVKNAKDINGIKLIASKFDSVDINELRSLSDDIKKDNKGVCMVFASVTAEKVTFLVSLTDDVVEKGLHAGNMIKQIAAQCGGGGGGKADMAQAGGKDPSKVDEALLLAESLLQ